MTMFNTEVTEKDNGFRYFLSKMSSVKYEIGLEIRFSMPPQNAPIQDQRIWKESAHKEKQNKKESPDIFRMKYRKDNVNKKKSLEREKFWQSLKTTLSSKEQYLRSAILFARKRVKIVLLAHGQEHWQ